MKKLFLTLSAILLASSAFAQVPIEWGVKAGFNLAGQTADGGSTDSRFGIHFGGFAEFTLNHRLGIQPELMFSFQGCKYADGSKTAVEKWDYINLPVILKIYVWDRRLSVDAGLQFGYLVNGKRKRGDTTTTFYDWDSINKFDASFCLGASFKFAQVWDAFMRFNMGMTKIRDGYSHRNSVFETGVGYRF